MVCCVPSSVGTDNHTSTSSPMALTWVTVPSAERSVMCEVSRSSDVMGYTVQQGWYIVNGVSNGWQCSWGRVCRHDTRSTSQTFTLYLPPHAPMGWVVCVVGGAVVKVVTMVCAVTY